MHHSPAITGDFKQSVCSKNVLKRWLALFITSD